MKLLLSCCIAPFLLLSNQVLAGSAEHANADNLDFGIAYKYYSMDLPSRVSSSEDDNANQFSALALIVTDDLTEYVSISFEAAKGIADANSSYDFTVEDIDIGEDYTAQLDYSISVTAKFRLLADTILRPYVLLGGNAAAISYDYQQKVAEVITDEDSETLTSTGITYGAGIELVTDHDIELSLSYENISHFKYDSYALSFEVIFGF